MIPWAKPVFWGNEADAVRKAVESTWISGGPCVERFEEMFADYCSVLHALTASNGTTAIHLAFLGLGLEPGDEIVVPGFGFLAAANMALLMGVKPLFADVDPDTWCVRAADFERCLTARTRALVPVHTYGNVCDMDAIVDLGRARGVAVVEDAAEAFTSRYRTRLAGTMGTVGTFSFQATKHITTGEGGMVVTHDAGLRDRMALYRSHGMLRQRYYWHELPGHNFRLTNFQAALGCAQMEHLDRIIAGRRRVHETYKANLGRLAGVALQQFTADVEPVLWAMAVLLDPRAFPQGRDAVMAQMKEAGVETRPGFYAPSAMSFYDCPPLSVCERLSQQIISLPTFPTLRDDEIERVCGALVRLKA